MKKFVRGLCGLVMLSLLLEPTCRAAAPEYQLEAAFLFNFTQFIEWPETSFADGHSPLVIGVLGEDPFDGYLDEIVRGEVINGHPLVVERYRRAEDIRHCHILFFSDPEITRVRAALIRLKGQSVLTVSNLPGFARAGGIVRFRIVDSHLRFRINIDAAQEARLVISSKLLKQAELVGGTEE